MYLKNTLFLFVLLFLVSCGDDKPTVINPIVTEGDLSDIPYNPQAYNLVRPIGFPSMLIPSDNALTEDGVELGRHLFYDPILSADSTMACVACHLPSMSFTDAQQISFGIDGVGGVRSSMSLINIGYVEKGLFWDGRSNTLEEQALIPVEDPIELHDTWENVEMKFKRHPTYPTMFRKAFGIEDTEEITKDLAVKAIAQFERTLISSDSRFDKVYYKEEAIFTDSESRGFDMFFDRGTSGLPDAECGHCHNLPLMTTDDFFNNALDSVASLADFEDLGRGGVTGDIFENGKFRAPTLRNIALTAPYMHDGRFETLEEVIDFYNESPNHDKSANVDANIRPLGLTEEQKEDLLNFLLTLTDTVFTQREAFQNPF